MEVCPLSCGVMFPFGPVGVLPGQPLSTALHGGLRLLHLPLPAPPSVSLAASLPALAQTAASQERYRLTMFRLSDRMV